MYIFRVPLETPDEYNKTNVLLSQKHPCYCRYLILPRDGGGIERNTQIRDLILV